MDKVKAKKSFKQRWLEMSASDKATIGLVGAGILITAAGIASILITGKNEAPQIAPVKVEDPGGYNFMITMQHGNDEVRFVNFFTKEIGRNYSEEVLGGIGQIIADTFGAPTTDICEVESYDIT